MYIGKKITYGLLQWNRLVVEKKVTEEEIVHREGITLINIECPSCGSHLWEVDKVYKRNNILLKVVFCQNCDFKNGERMVASE